ncbi:MAG: endonuclease/exonuclease/phosphatase family protein [Gemmatimonadota bacterium]|nr:endonuclease/exonuclease/phosphatase family protein [Gemmatimonadota bacterium]
MKRILLLVAIPLVLAACADRVPTGLSGEAAVLEQPAFKSANSASNLTVASVNMYFGASVEEIIDAAPEQVPVEVAKAWAILLQTDFPARARAMAAELAKAKPHLIGLQEAAILKTEEFFDPTSEATEVVFFDFLEVLLQELHAWNAHYEVAVMQTDANVELPKLEDPFGTPYLSGVRLIDRDVILARSDVPVRDPAKALFAFWLGPATTGGVVPIDVFRGWTAVTATVHGQDYRFVNTHLESEDRLGLHQIRTAQAFELTQVLAGETLPLIVLGDFNSGPGRPVSDGETPAYDLLIGSGYMDAGLLLSGSKTPENTCCHESDLSNMSADLDQRIDLVFVTNMMDLGKKGGMPIVQMSLLNEEYRDLRKYGVWSSDHASVIARFTLPNPQSNK